MGIAAGTLASLVSITHLPPFINQASAYRRRWYLLNKYAADGGLFFDSSTLFFPLASDIIYIPATTYLVTDIYVVFAAPNDAVV